jgi:LysM repeat protein
MPFFGRISLLCVVAVALAAGGGCSGGDGGQLDEEKEPHYVLGTSRYNEQDWPGAIEAFEESLEVNPQSAAAHYRLGMIFDNESPDPAAAIYHYQQYLKLQPDAGNRDLINQRIHSCKVLLATDVCGLPDAPALLKQMDSLVDTNRQLQAQLDKLTDQLKRWNEYYASLKAAGMAGNNNDNSPGSGSSPGAQEGALSPTPDDISSETRQTAPAKPKMTGPRATEPSRPSMEGAQPRWAPLAEHPAKSHVHIVARGDTMASIARKHELSLYAVEAANPGVNPKKLYVGQSIILPP